MTTDELLARARGGDRGAYEALFAAAAERLLVYLELRLGGLKARLDPLDALQETYLEAHRSFDRFRGQTLASFRAWLYAIADNRLLDLADHHGARKRSPQGEQVPVSQVIEELRGSRTGPGTAVARREEHERLRSALEALEPAEREAILLHHFHGLTREQVAERLGLTVKQARSLLARARWRLGSSLRDSGSDVESR